MDKALFANLGTGLELELSDPSDDACPGVVGTITALEAHREVWGGRPRLAVGRARALVAGGVMSEEGCTDCRFSGEQCAVMREALAAG